MCELLWSDPQAEPGRSPSKRGVGVAFGTHAALAPVLQLAFQAASGMVHVCNV